jgi:hypothetical protein
MVIGWPTEASRHNTIAQKNGKRNAGKKSN